MQKKSDDFSLQDIMRLANSPAGQQLIAMLQKQNNPEFRQAATQAASGNYSQAKKTVQTLLRDPQIRALLQQLQEGTNG